MNAVYSPNLGDGLLAECLVESLLAHGAAAGTSSVDLAARSQFGDSMAGRGLVLSVLRRLPTGLRELVVRAPIAVASRRNWAPHYAAKLQGAGAVVLGGGNLLTDFDLNFPTKLALALDTARSIDVPVAIYACGMGDRWTREGDQRLRKALTAQPLRSVFLRDEMSKARWDARFAEATGTEAVVARDPGLLARDVYPALPPRARGSEPVIGLGLMSHTAVCYHAGIDIGLQEFGGWYLDLARALKKAGARVVAFTNGAPEDCAAAEALAPELGALGVETARPRTPNELVNIIAGFDAITAFRMHAVIAAYSYAVPALALKWDDKLDSFMASVGRSDWMADLARLPAEQAAKRLMQAAEQGVDPVQQAKVVSDAHADVNKLLKSLL